MNRGLAARCARCHKNNIKMIFIVSIFGSALRALPIYPIRYELDIKSFTIGPFWANGNLALRDARDQIILLLVPFGPIAWKRKHA